VDVPLSEYPIFVILSLKPMGEANRNYLEMAGGFFLGVSKSTWLYVMKHPRRDGHPNVDNSVFAIHKAGF